MSSIPHPLRILLSLRWIFLLIYLALSVRSVCYSQHIAHVDSSAYQSEFELFDDAIGIENTGIINGIKYSVPFQILGTHPFYKDATAAKGNVTFHEQPYFNLVLLYDIYSDEIVVQQARATGAQALIKLYKADVESFRIYDHTFRNYQGDSAKKLGMAGGFYDVLYENNVFTVLAKRKKSTRIQTGGTVQYETDDHYFFIRNGSFTAFRGMKNFNQVLGDKNLISDLRTYVSKNNLRIKNSDIDLIRVAQYCDTILNKRQ